ncbi:metallophosphoesterase family protein [Agrococcus baldri]|uniref:Phosphohydrolase n=1 Tax=Agrococcus baldri TaxID=153730 RepID=A0AA87RCH7_9MICO|nr:metallophosphoesterase [Agrococcus baldri]GEK80286.1 phosphohydrolase [Agrococcus baldri]
MGEGMSAASGRRTILHLSDVHATHGGLLYDAVDGIERLERVGRYAIDAGVTPEAIVITGDLVERGHAAAYPRLREALDRLCCALGAPVLAVVGNHDTAAAATLLGDDGWRAPGSLTADRIAHVGDLRFALLDSADGALHPQQLARLRDALAEPFGLGTVVALHHPPLPSPLPSLAKQSLANGDELMRLLAGTDARLVLAGHFHHPMWASQGGVPISVGPSLVYQQVMDAVPGTVAGDGEAMFSLVHLTGASVSASSVRLTSPAPLFTRHIVVPA